MPFHIPIHDLVVNSDARTRIQIMYENIMQVIGTEIEAGNFPADVLSKVYYIIQKRAKPFQKKSQIHTQHEQKYHTTPYPVPNRLSASSPNGSRQDNIVNTTQVRDGTLATDAFSALRRALNRKCSRDSSTSMIVHALAFIRLSRQSSNTHHNMSPVLRMFIPRERISSSNDNALSC